MQDKLSERAIREIRRLEKVAVQAAQPLGIRVNTWSVAKSRRTFREYIDTAGGAFTTGFEEIEDGFISLLLGPKALDYYLYSATIIPDSKTVGKWKIFKKHAGPFIYKLDPLGFNDGYESAERHVSGLVMLRLIEHLYPAYLLSKNTDTTFYNKGYAFSPYLNWVRRVAPVLFSNMDSETRRKIILGGAIEGWSDKELRYIDDEYPVLFSSYEVPGLLAMDTQSSMYLEPFIYMRKAISVKCHPT